MYSLCPGGEYGPSAIGSEPRHENLACPGVVEDEGSAVGRPACHGRTQNSAGHLDRVAAVAVANPQLLGARPVGPEGDLVPLGRVLRRCILAGRGDEPGPAAGCNSLGLKVEAPDGQVLLEHGVHQDGSLPCQRDLQHEISVERGRLETLGAAGGVLEFPQPELAATVRAEHQRPAVGHPVLPADLPGVGGELDRLAAGGGNDTEFLPGPVVRANKGNGLPIRGETRVDVSDDVLAGPGQPRLLSRIQRDDEDAERLVSSLGVVDNQPAAIRRPVQVAVQEPVPGREDTGHYPLLARLQSRHHDCPLRSPEAEVREASAVGRPRGAAVDGVFAADPARRVLAGGLDPNAGRRGAFLLPDECDVGGIGCHGGLEFLAGQTGDRNTVQFRWRGLSSPAHEQESADRGEHDQGGWHTKKEDGAAGRGRGSLRFDRGLPRQLGGLLRDGDGPEDAVAPSGKRLDVTGLSVVGGDSFSNDGDVLREVRLVNDAVRPDRRHQVLFCDHLPGVFQEGQKRLHRLSGQMNRLVLPQQHLCGGVEPKKPESEDPTCFQGATLILDLF